MLWCVDQNCWRITMEKTVEFTTPIRLDPGLTAWSGYENLISRRLKIPPGTSKWVGCPLETAGHGLAGSAVEAHRVTLTSQQSPGKIELLNNPKKGQFNKLWFLHATLSPLKYSWKSHFILSPVGQKKPTMMQTCLQSNPIFFNNTNGVSSSEIVLVPHARLHRTSHAKSFISLIGSGCLCVKEQRRSLGNGTATYWDGGWFQPRKWKQKDVVSRICWLIG